MLYTTITVGEKELRLRLRTQDCVALEREIGKNPISVFSGIESGDLPTISNAAASRSRNSWNMLSRSVVPTLRITSTFRRAFMAFSSTFCAAP